MSDNTAFIVGIVLLILSWFVIPKIQEKRHHKQFANQQPHVRVFERSGYAQLNDREKIEKLTIEVCKLEDALKKEEEGNQIDARGFILSGTVIAFLLLWFGLGGYHAGIVELVIFMLFYSILASAAAAFPFMVLGAAKKTPNSLGIDVIIFDVWLVAVFILYIYGNSSV